jgi:predicted lipid carrier protein YhbT
VFSEFKKQIKTNVVAAMPAVLRVPVSITPFSLQRTVLAHGLALVFKEALEDGDLDFLNGRWMLLEITDIKGCWYLSQRDGQLVVAADAPQTDVRFAGSLNDFVLLMGRKEDPDTLFFQRRLIIEGDTELGLEIKNLIDGLDYDNLPTLLTRAMDISSSWVADYA